MCIAQGGPPVANGGNDMMVEEGHHNPNPLPNGNAVANAVVNVQTEDGAMVNAGDVALPPGMVLGFGGVPVPAAPPGFQQNGQPPPNARNSVWARWAFDWYQQTGGPMSDWSESAWLHHFNAEWPNLRD